MTQDEEDRIKDWITWGIGLCGLFIVLVFILGACDFNICGRAARDDIIRTHHYHWD